MQITVNVPEDVIHTAVGNAVNNAFSGTAYDRGPGQAIIREQVTAWVRGQDYTAEIERQAPAIVRSIIADELAKAVRALVKREVKAMKDNGELAGLFNMEADE